MTRSWWFPLAVFGVTLAMAVGAIGALGLFTRPAEIPVAHAVTSSPASGQNFDSAAVDRYAVEFLRTTGIPGVSIAIVRGGEIVHTAGYGRGVDGAPLTADTPMPVASVSKSMTAAAIMALVQDGAIDLDAPVPSYLPAFAPADERGGAVTVRQLLNQTSGLPDVTHGRAGPPQTLAELLSRLNAEPFASEPGGVWAYNSANYTLIAMLAEQVGGEPFAQLLRRRVFAPIGMSSSSSFANTDDPQTPVAQGYRLLYGAPLPARAPRDALMFGAGGVVSSANDLARWLVVQSADGRTLDGARLYSAESMSAMHEPPADLEYAFGWRTRTKSDGTPFLFHAGRNVAYAAYQAVFPESRDGYAIAWNALHPFGAEQANFYEGIYAILSGAEPAPLLSFGSLVDGIAAALTALAISIALVGVVRARNLVCRRSLAIVALRTTPYALAAAGAILFPSLWFGVSWAETLVVWPAFAIFLGATAIGAFAVIGARVLQLATRATPALGAGPRDVNPEARIQP